MAAGMRASNWIVPAMVISAVAGLARSASADSLSFDFSSGIGPNFVVRNDDGRWTVGSDSTGLRVTWDSSLGAPFPFATIQGGIGGVDGVFTIGGDFTITVEYALHQFPVLSFDGLIDSVLGVGPVQAGIGRQFEVLRFANENAQYIEGFVTEPPAPLSPQLNSDTSGRYRITRTGSVISGYFASGSSSTFTPLGSRPSGFDGPMHPFLIGFYVVRAGEEPDVLLDISFNNLTIEADQIVGVVPEPGTLVLCGVGIAVLKWWRRKARGSA